MGNIDQVRGGQLKEMRTRARLSQRQVGEHFGIDKSAVSEWERGLARPTVDKLKRLDSLYGGAGEVLKLFDVAPPSGRRSGDNTVETLRIEVTRLAEVVARLAEEFAEFRGRTDPPSGARAR